MGQAAGLKRRKGRAGNHIFNKNVKTKNQRQKHIQKAGLKLMGLDTGDGAQCLMTRLERGGFVSNLKKFRKPDTRQFLGKPLNELMTKAEKVAKQKKESSASLIDVVEQNRREAKLKSHERRTIVIPKTTVKLFSYFLDKYGEDYKMMSQDQMNYDQMTPAQLKKNVQSFKSSVQFVDYLMDRVLMPSSNSRTKTEAEGTDVTAPNDDEAESKNDGTAASDDMDIVANTAADSSESEEEISQAEKLQAVLKSMKKAERQLKKQLTSRPAKRKLVEEVPVELNEVNKDELDDEEILHAKSKQHRKNILKRRKMKKLKQVRDLRHQKKALLKQ